MAPGYFDVPKSIVNGKPQYGEDGDFIYGSGHFPLLAGKTERLSLALVYGGGLATRDQDIDDMLKHRETVQKIYNSNYKFPQPPDKPTLTAVPGDQQVTLYWDRKAEKSFDPVLKEYDFEGYKIYRATDPNFNDVNGITDANGIVVGFIPLAQFDLIDSVKGYFRANDQLFQDTKGYSFYLGSDNGIQHMYVDENVENGRKYYYALVAYDKGNSSIDILPSENTKFISILSSGEVKTDINTTVVIPNADKAGFVAPPSSIKLEKVKSDGTGSVYYKVVDATALDNSTYEVSFSDTRSKGTYVPITTSYTVKDLTRRSETFAASDTVFTKLKHNNLIGSTVQLTETNGNAVPSSSYILDTLRGRIKASKHNSLSAANYKISFLYNPVFESPYIIGSPYVSEAKDADNFDGLQLYFNNDWSVKLNDTLSVWNTGTRQYNFTFSTLNIDDPPLKANRYPSDYEIRFGDKIIDTSSTLYGSVPIPVNFTIINTTDNQKVDFLFSDNDNNQLLSSLDQIYFFEKDKKSGDYKYTWVMNFSMPVGRPDTTFIFKAGDLLKIFTTKPFRNGDVWKFSVKPAEVNSQNAANELNNVKVVPNPYIAATTHESPLPPSITSGRGERKIEFIHVPPNSTIDIFTSRGEHIKTLHSDNSVFNGSVTWNLKTKENLDVAYGVYFYILDCPYGKKDGRIAIIK